MFTKKGKPYLEVVPNEETYEEESLIRLDLADDDDYYYVYVDVPGKKINDIKMKFKGNNLSIKIVEESEESNLIANKSCIIQERIHDEVERLIPLEDPIDKKKVDARLENGLLIVSVKKIDPNVEEDEDLITIKSY